MDGPTHGPASPGTAADHAIVRRRPPQTLEQRAPFTADLLPARRHVGTAFAVESEILWPAVTPDGRLKGPPELRLRWQLNPGGSGIVVGFRRTCGFGCDGDFGECIVSSRNAGENVERLEPGDYFYSFFTARSVLGLARAYTNEVRFAENVPSVPKVLELMRNAIEYRKLQREYEALTQPEEPPPEPEYAAAKWEREFQQALAGMDLRLGAAERLRERWRDARRQIESGPYADGEKRRRLRALNGMMREFREQFEL